MAVAVVFLISSSADARPTYPSTIPTGFSCSTCHFSPGGGGAKNSFGNAYSGNRVWSSLCELDSDNDGFTNGEEFGDPDCEWQLGDALPNFDATRPGDSTDFPIVCGDGGADGDEECDQDDLNGNTCESEGFDGGVLSCNEDCTLRTTECTTDPEECGNGVLEGDEECDGEDLNDATCESEGFAGGELGCNEDCSFDIGECTIIIEGCGDGEVDDGEDCDGENLDGATCESEGFAGGELGCNEDCSFDIGQCTVIVDGCGDGEIDEGEDCDGEELGGAVCGDVIEGSVGELACAEDCTFDLDACEEETPEPDPTPEMTPDPTPEMSPDPAPEMTPDPTPSSSGGDDGCSVGIGQTGGGGLLLALLAGFLVIGRRRRRR